MLQRFLRALATLGLLLLSATPAHAGMPWFPPAQWWRPTLLADLTRQRLEAISFFVLGFLACGLFIQWIWNSLRRDFARLPRLSYPRALGVVTLWGLLFVLVLTMISGARELMTPGAWEKKGATYRLAQPGPLQAIAPFESGRYSRLQSLSDALVEYAEKHDGAFPAKGDDPAIPAEYWLASKVPLVRFTYLGGRKTPWDDEAQPLAYEAAPVNDARLVLFSNGWIELRAGDDFLRARRSTGP